MYLFHSACFTWGWRNVRSIFCREGNISAVTGSEREEMCMQKNLIKNAGIHSRKDELLKKSAFCIRTIESVRKFQFKIVPYFVVSDFENELSVSGVNTILWKQGTVKTQPEQYI